MNFLLNLSSATLLVAFSVNLGLSLYIYFNDRKNVANRAFSALLFAIAFWTLSFFTFAQATSPFWALFWRRCTPVGSSLIASFFLYFAVVFPRRKTALSSLQKLIILIPGFIFSYFSVFSNLMIREILITDSSMLFLGKPVFGPLYKLFAIFFISYFATAAINLFYKYFKAQGRERLQIWYVLFGILIAGIAGIITSLILPLFGVSRFFIAGPLFTLFLVSFVSYAIIRHRLLNIEDFLSRGIILLTLVGAIVVTVVVMTRKEMVVFLLPIYAMMANFSLGGVVLIYNPRNTMNRFFSALVFCIAFWSLANFLSDVSTAYIEALFWNKMVFAVSAIIPIFSVLFSIYFPEVLIEVDSKRKTFIVLSGIIIAFLSIFTDTVVKSIYYIPSGTAIIFGPLFIIHSLYVICVIAYAFYFLSIKYFKSQSIHKMQVRYVFFGCFFSSFFALLTNVIMPMFGFFALAKFGPSFTLILIAFITYAILRHRLMSIEVVIQKGAIYTVATALIMAVYAAAVVVSETFFRGVLGYTSLAITAGATLLIAVAYQPLVKSFQSITDALFFKDHYDYQKTLNKFSRALTSAIRVEELAMLLTYSFIKTIRVSRISFLLPDKGDYASVHLHLPQYRNIRLDGESPVVSWLKTKKDILVADEIEEALSRHEYAGEEANEAAGRLKFLRAELTRLVLPIWVPIISKEKLVGIIALGEKLSGDIFTAEDIALLNTLANQTAVSLENARLYDEVVSVKDYNEEILQSMLNGIITTDARGKIVTCNSMAGKIIGKKQSEVVGRNVIAVWGEDGEITKIIENTLKDRCCHNFKGDMDSPLKGEIPVSFSSTLLRDSYGRKSGSLVVLRDLSEVRELEEKVRRADKLSALATMAAGMAHEIKNPLSSMKVFAQLLPQKFNDDEYRKKLEEILPREIDRIDRVVESLISFARSTTPTFEKIKIESLLEETLKYYEDKASGAGVKINRQYAELPEIEVDQGQMSQVFSNLVLNAIQAMTEGGELTVSSFAGKVEEETIKNIKVRIMDTGPGLSEEMLKKLFEPFFTTKHGGTGLGLTITHSIVESHKGSMEVESQVGKGTVFTVTLPVKQ